ncbi:MAG TPA: methyltransferase domain-containing protein [Mycobacteriales bacterium]|nr:methyltransferase domain-containing protein [Mycobacteriales bacterium]
MNPAVVACLACPYCAADLVPAPGALRCPAGHSFDLARQGYVTLLPRGARGPAGDTAGMVAARDRFLAAGHYAPLTRALVAAAAGAGPGAVLDVGAGTGHHLAAVLDAAAGRVGVALDASRYAARRAARAHPRAGAVVADAWRGLPVRTAAAGLVLDVFAPRNGPEIARVLAPGGQLLVVTPAADHLAELVGALGLLTVDERKDERLAGSLEPHLAPVDRTEHRWPLSLPVADAVAAAAMGPSAHHLDPAELADRAAALPDPVPTTAAVVLTRYRAG